MITRAHAECERYASNMERALERIRSICRVLRAAGATNVSDADIDEALAIIEETAYVRDCRTTITDETPVDGATIVDGEVA